MFALQGDFLHFQMLTQPNISCELKSHHHKIWKHLSITEASNGLVLFIKVARIFLSVLSLILKPFFIRQFIDFGCLLSRHFYGVNF